MTTTEATMTTASQNKTSTTRSRILAILAFVLLSVPAFAQTVMPTPRQQFLDNNGLPLASGKLYTYAAGTSTPLATCTNVSNPCSAANTNPIILDSAGRATVFLTTASYKFVLATSADVIIWTVDNISSVAPFNVDLDITGVAGEALVAGDLVYLSNGSGALTSGRWYKTDADLTYASTGASEIGIAPAAIASGASGSIRLSGRVTGLSALATGSDYYASGTGGGLTSTPPANPVRVGRAESSSVLVLGNFASPASPRGPPCGRLTLTTGVPVTTADVTAATTLYYAPYGGCNQISLFDGAQWNASAFAQLSIAVPATTATVYDVFAYDNSGVIALELTAWTNGTTRATALTTQNGVYVKTGALTRLYLGTFRTTAVSGQTEDSDTKRYVWNYYNRVSRRLLKNVSTNSWTYTTSTWRQANADTANQVEFVIGVAETLLRLDIGAITQNDTGNAYVGNAIGLDSTSVISAGGQHAFVQIKTASEIVNNRGTFETYPAVGYHFAALLERSQAVGVTTWHSNGSLFAGEQTGVVGFIEG